VVGAYYLQQAVKVGKNNGKHRLVGRKKSRIISHHLIFCKIRGKHELKKIIFIMGKLFKDLLHVISYFFKVMN